MTWSKAKLLRISQSIFKHQRSNKAKESCYLRIVWLSVSNEKGKRRIRKWESLSWCIATTVINWKRHQSCKSWMSMNSEWRLLGQFECRELELLKFNRQSSFIFQTKSQGLTFSSQNLNISYSSSGNMGFVYIKESWRPKWVELS